MLQRCPRLRRGWQQGLAGETIAKDGKAVQMRYTLAVQLAHLQVFPVQVVLVLVAAAKVEPGSAAGHSLAAADRRRRLPQLRAAVLQETSERGDPRARADHDHRRRQAGGRGKGAAAAKEDGQAGGGAVAGFAASKAAAEAVQPGGGHALVVAVPLSTVPHDRERHVRLRRMD